MDLPNLVAITIHWVFLPIVLIGLFFFGVTIWTNAPDGELNTSATSGFWAGLVLFFIFAAAQLPQVRTPRFDVNASLALDPAQTVVGMIIGFALLGGIRFAAPTRLVGVIVLVLTACSLMALYGYVFIESLRGVVLFVSLGIAFGSLLHLVLFPSAGRDIWRKRALIPSP